jgi:ElaA protein
MSISWRDCHFAELSVHELYDVLRLRSAVFVLEQQCLYQDMDNQDHHAHHLLGTQDGILLAYARLFAPGQIGEEASIGRVATAGAARGSGYGRQLLREAIAAVQRRWGVVPIKIGAQKYLLEFYASFGFTRIGDDYLEDGIAHVPMRLDVSARK